MSPQKLKADIQDSELPLASGTPVMVQVGGMGKQFKTVSVGLLPEQCLILALPPSEGVGYLYDEGNQITIRFIQEGRIYGFRTHILGKYLRAPCRFLFLDYPLKVETHVLREKPRLQCLLLAKLASGTFALDGLLLDIGPGGTKFIHRLEDESEHPEDLATGLETILSIQLMGMDKAEQLNCLVRNVVTDGDFVELGLEFTNPDTPFIKTISEYLDEANCFLS